MTGSSPKKGEAVGKEENLADLGASESYDGAIAPLVTSIYPSIPSHVLTSHLITSQMIDVPHDPDTTADANTCPERTNVANCGSCVDTGQQSGQPWLK